MYDVIPQQRHQHHDTGAPPRSPHLSCTYRNCCCPRADTSDPRDVTTTQAQARCAGAGFSPLPCSVSAAAPPPHSSPLIPSSSAVILVSGARYGLAMSLWRFGVVAENGDNWLGEMALCCSRVSGRKRLCCLVTSVYVLNVSVENFLARFAVIVGFVFGGACVIFPELLGFFLGLFSVVIGVEEKEKLDTQIRKITKKVLGVPMCTSNDLLLQLGIHNSFYEIAEAQERAQIVRLSTTSAGRQILRELGVPQERISLLHVGIPLKARQWYHVKPIPRNMHPERNVGRRKARGARLLRLIHDENQRVSFVDTSFNKERKAFTVVVVDNEGTVVNAASVRTDRPDVDKQAAIALSLVDRSRPFVYSNIKSAVKGFEKGSVA
ncbi:hypothetical protein HPB48_014180 [Haemaphysalis longicornis]|uniref:Uncharacterized protein n=1 Tax=Haemaphysalis longicornis TaxID=44386 RepID=A0A9J6F9X2_HAELO|nr:hypothetical protein HPB48_014180 [Haemaphysalis longicornis]